MFNTFIAQAPPPPTLMPVPTAPITMPGIELWESTEHLVQIWNQNSSVTTGAQYLIVALLVLIGLMMFVRMIKSMGQDES